MTTRTSKLGTVVLAAVVVAAAADCGGNDGGSSCATFKACGGAISPGTYKMTSQCAVAGSADLGDDCHATADVSGLSVEGTVTLNGNMTYSSTEVDKGVIALTLSASCLVDATCSDLQEGLNEDPGIMSVFSRVSCSGSPTCVCVFTFNGAEMKETGSYRATGSTLTMTPSGQPAEAADYCAAGPTLTMREYPFATSSMGMMGDFAVVQTLTKQ